MALKKSQVERIEQILNSTSSLAEFKKTIARIKDPIELHQIAFLKTDTGAWHETGFEFPMSIVEHPYCDAGTALMVYWSESPEFYYEYGGHEDAEEEDRATLEFLRSVAESYLSGEFKTAKIKTTTPLRLTPKEISKYKWIPAGMLVPSPGRAIKPISWTEQDDGSFRIG